MNCRRVINSMSAYVDGELTGAEMLELRRHLNECPDCLEEYESLRQVKLAMGRLRTVAPREDFAVCILSKLDEVSIPPYQRALSKFCTLAARKLSPVAAALAVSGVALAFLAAGGQDRILTEKPDVVASAPLNLRLQTASYMPDTSDGPVIYSSTKPLVVADHSRGMTFSLAGLSTQ